MKIGYARVSTKDQTVALQVDALKKVMWLTVQNPKFKKKLAQWQRSAWIDDDGMIFLPAPVSGKDEMEVLLCAAHDGVSVVT